MTGNFDEALPDAAARRMSNQLDRAFRGTYGARTGLQTIVRSIARQMLRAGSSPEGTARMLERYVADHPPAVSEDAQHSAADAKESQLLVELTRACVAEVVRETGTAGTTGTT